MLISRKIKVLHIEPTDVCQARCPLCARETNLEFDPSIKHHLDMDQILAAFGAEHIANLNKMFMCGDYGDPAAGQHTIDIYRAFRDINHNITLGMNTNGGLRDPTWWRDLAELISRSRDYVVFSIDGLEDTNHVYRRGVDWHRLMTNVETFISAGGNAQWDMLVYQHNQHQVEQCEQLAKSLGFGWFRAKVSRRPLRDRLQYPVGWQKPIAHGTEIRCHALDEQSIYLDARGHVWPCCFLASKLGLPPDWDQIQQSWSSPQPNPVCLNSCGQSEHQTMFLDQWQKNIALNTPDKIA